MLFDRRLGFVLLCCALSTTSACHRASQVAASAKLPVASPASLSPDDIVRARAPSDEIIVLNGKRDFTGAAQDAPVADRAQVEKAVAWKKIVLGVGQFHDWAAYTRAIDGMGRIEVVLSDGLVFYAGVPKDSRLFGVIESLSENSQPVVISGRISPSFLGAAEVSDDPKHPTCFENRFGPPVCEIELTNIAPLH